MKKSEYAIQVKGLRKSFGKLTVLDGVNFTVKRGTILALLGPNGAGKTTTVKILSTLLQPNGGKAKINGHDVTVQPDEVRKVIGLTGQYAAVDEYLTGRENLQMIGRLYRLSVGEATLRADNLLDRFDLVEAGSRPVRTYSGGMRRRLDLAMSLIASPPIIFLDEPTTGLDPRSRMTMWKIIKQLASKGTTILLTTQYMEEADRLADNIVVIDDGRVIAEGTSNELKSKIGSDRLEVTVADKGKLNAAMDLVMDKNPTADKEARMISIATKRGVTELRQVLQLLEDNKIKVENVSLRRPTLDDVFLSLTGHGAEKITDEDERPKGAKK